MKTEDEINAIDWTPKEMGIRRDITKAMYKRVKDLELKLKKVFNT